jgi:hypothetical protein
MVKFFERKKLNPQVLQTIRQQAEETGNELAAETGQDEKGDREK